ncbi:MAG: hypothetical protein K0U47_06165 [Epsilonproteobacteria bacterium]|nr:hypothetical protein [Campylobacterota bacterium]
MNIKRPNYNPLYFLAALGAGGLSVSFFVYINFMVPHKGVPMATFEFIYQAVKQGDWLSFFTLFSLLLVLFFAFFHIKLLIWNIKEFSKFKKTDAYQTLKNSNAEVTLMTIPLTLAMSVNVAFVIFAVFVPGLWNIVEYLFPGALLAFAVAGYYALKIFVHFFTRLLITGEFDCDANNSLAQMISIFAFAMVAVGFAAPAAMSHTIAVNAIGTVGAIFFSSIAIVLIVIKIVLGFKNMFEHGISVEASPTLWIMIPILTLLGITMIRVNFGFDHHFDAAVPKTYFFLLTSIVISLQVLFGALGYSVMKKMRYFEDYIDGEKQSVPSFALICPGVAFTVFWIFFVHLGLVYNGVVDKFSLWYFVVLTPILFIHLRTVQYFFKLKKHFAL